MPTHPNGCGKLIDSKTPFLEYAAASGKLSKVQKGYLETFKIYSAHASEWDTQAHTCGYSTGYWDMYCWECAVKRGLIW